MKMIWKIRPPQLPWEPHFFHLDAFSTTSIIHIIIYKNNISHAAKHV